MFGPSKEGSQAQRAGDGSTLIQAAGDINLGVSEERAHEIALETSKHVISEFTADANALIQDRILKLDDRVIASLVREGRLQVFADPGFQRTYRKAQEGAAVSDRDNDYDLLAALMVDRAERGSQRPIRAGIDRAVEVIDRVDDEALRGLTIFQTLSQHTPLNGDIDMGLNAMENLLGQLLDGPLPIGREWLDHLDILDSVRISSVNELRKFQDYWFSGVPGYLSTGIEATSAPQSPLHERTGFSAIIVPHKFKEGFVRVAAPSKGALEKWSESLDPESRQTILNDAESIFRLSDIDEACRQPLMDLVQTLPALNKISTWWDSIPHAFSLTSVGRVLARANAERLDHKNMLPPLD